MLYQQSADSYRKVLIYLNSVNLLLKLTAERINRSLQAMHFLLKDDRLKLAIDKRYTSRKILYDFATKSFNGLQKYSQMIEKVRYDYDYYTADSI